MNAPGTTAVAREQRRCIGLSMRRELVVVGALMLLGLLPWIVVDARFAPPPQLDPAEALGYLAAGLALLFPIAVWRGEKAFGESTLWLLPVEHRRHAAIKAFAGWVWLMAIVATGVMWTIAVVLLGEGTIASEMAQLVTVDTANRVVDRVMLPVPWWHWLLPFTGATAAYLFGSALWIGTRHPFRWAALAWGVVLVIAMVAEEMGGSALVTLFETMEGTFDMIVANGAGSRPNVLRLAAGEPVVADPPTFGRWAAITAASLVAGLTAFALAARRSREA